MQRCWEVIDAQVCCADAFDNMNLEDVDDNNCGDGGGNEIDNDIVIIGEQIICRNIRENIDDQIVNQEIFSSLSESSSLSSFSGNIQC